MSSNYRRRTRDRQGTRRVAALLLLLLVAGVVSGQTSATLWERSREAMQYGRIDEAIPLLEGVTQTDPANGEAVRMLAVAYEQSGTPDRAATILESAVSAGAIPAETRARIAFDLAMLRSRHGESDVAAMYSRALELDNGLTSAYLNRANAYVADEAWQDARRDYQLYLALRPDTPQRPQIERMIVLLSETIEAERIARAEEERRRQEQLEAERRAEEEQRRAEEERRRAEEERRARMLDSVLQSLDNASEDAESIELESEDIRSYDDDIDILD